MQRFLYSARSVILVISFQAALLAGLLALTDRRCAIVPFALLVLANVVLHAISNLSNDYFSARRRHGCIGSKPCVLGEAKDLLLPSQRGTITASETSATPA